MAETGGMRAAMPQCAAMVDGLRQDFGGEVIDALLRRAQRGAAVVYLAELADDGTVREWGRAPSGRRARVVDGQMRMMREHARG